MKKFMNGLMKAENVVTAASFSVMVFIAAGNVFSRKVLHQSWSFTEEITGGLFVVITMLGAAGAARDGSHIGFSLFTDYLPQAIRKKISLITMLIAVFFFGYLLIYGVEMVWSEMVSNQTTPAMGWPEWIFGLTIPVGSVFLMAHFTERALTEAFQKGGDKE
ncbi:hypothetical protein AGMMS50276_04560 [Synergistales bacterium]|nr:hypothetical protein AGMMS50276_04560 [Synergistales bacterium]